MLVRSAAGRQRRHPSQTLAASFAQLRLPWLAAAQLRWAALQSPSTQSTSARSRQRSSSASRSPSQSRQLATAADLSATRSTTLGPPSGYSNAFKNSLHDTHLPWDFSRPGNGSSRTPGMSPATDPVILPQQALSVPSQLKIFTMHNGTMTELLQHLQVSLLVGRLERARAIILRLVKQSTPSSPEVIYAHSAYLEQCYKSLCHETHRSTKATSGFKEMQHWLEAEVRGKGTQPDAKMLVLMVKATIKALAGLQRDAEIKRYLAFAREIDAETYEDVRNSEHYGDEDFAAVERACNGRPQGLEEQVTSEGAVSNIKEPETAPLEISSTQAVAEIRSTMLKGSGLSDIKRAMSVLTDGPPLPANATAEERLAHAYELQQMLETASVDIALDRWRHADEDLRKIGINTSLQTRPIAALMWQWHQALLPTLKKEVAEVKAMYSSNAAKEDDRAAYGSYLELLPLDRVAAITILHIMGLIAARKKTKSFDVPLAGAAESLGMAIEQECAVDASSKKEKENGKKLSASQVKRLKQAIARRLKRRKTGGNSLASSFDLPNEQILAQMAWPMAVHVKLGAMLISKLLEVANLPVTRSHPRTQEKITQMQPALLYRHKFVRGGRQGILNPNPALAEKLESEPVPSLLAKRMPMIVPPKPWTGLRDGAYLHYKSEIMRAKGSDRGGLEHLEVAHRNGDLSQIFAGLNALGKVPWKVNQAVFDVQLAAWNSGEAVANFAPLDAKLDLPEQPDNMEDAHVRRRWLAAARSIGHKRDGLHSQRCYQNFQLEVARGALNRTIYFPHNIDFRGRAYPIPPYLNHMGADNVRALLVFAEGKPLGERGLRWLKIHLATVAGYDKASLDDRVQYVEDHLDDIYDSVRDPLGGRRWWLKAEDAWQVLAACFELTKALDSPDPRQFVSYLPMHQDGTCNGLQHYAALGGDEAGAKQVNLEPGETPSDIYSAVADAVREEVRIDAEKGNIVAQKLHGHITRKVVKQPVMTNVYGVTFFGARAQVRKQLANVFTDMEPNDQPDLMQLSHYVTVKIFGSLGKMFTGAQAIQSWLGQCAGLISTCLTPEQVQRIISSRNIQGDSDKPAKKAMVRTRKDRLREYTTRAEKVPQQFRSSVVWTTPLGLPVVQPYRKSSARVIKTNIASITLSEPQLWDPVSKRKQLQAFAPNFIHSLDSTHMLLSAVKSTEAGLTFASIHDSFWTHACDVDTLSTVLRDAFIDMHSQDIVGRLRDEFITRYGGALSQITVKMRSSAHFKVMRARKELKIRPNDASELAIEVERIRLLSSSDPEERAKGESMVTPASIWEAEGKADVYLETKDFANQQLGRMPEDVSALPSDVELPDVAPEAVFEEDVLGPDETVVDVVPDEADVLPSEEAIVADKVARRHLVRIWRPVEFPPVPPKGSFDVTRLRDSKYFFS